jgi:transcription elongation factor GreA-like protein
MPNALNPGSFVRLDGRPDWGVGQIQTVVGARVTVNFEHSGKQLINTDRATLVAVDIGTSGR